MFKVTRIRAHAYTHTHTHTSISISIQILVSVFISICNECVVSHTLFEGVGNAARGKKLQKRFLVPRLLSICYGVISTCHQLPTSFVPQPAANI